MGARRSRIGDTAAITRIIIRDGAPFAMLIDDPKLGRYLVPPIVLDDQGNVIEGHDALSAMHQAGVQIESTDGGVWKGRTPGGAKVVHPYLTDRMPGDLAQIDQVMAQLSGASACRSALLWRAKRPPLRWPRLKAVRAQSHRSALGDVGQGDGPAPPAFPPPVRRGGAQPASGARQWGTFGDLRYPGALAALLP
jgi:hypothetical protein